MTPAEAAAALGIGLCRVHQRIRAGTLPAVKVPAFKNGNRWKWEVTALVPARPVGRAIGALSRNEKWELVRQREHWVIRYEYRVQRCPMPFSCVERTTPAKEREALDRCRARRDEWLKERARAMRKARAKRKKQRDRFGKRDVKTGRFKPRRKEA